MTVVAIILQLNKMLLLLDMCNIQIEIRCNYTYFYFTISDNEIKIYNNHIGQYNKIMARIKSETPNLLTYIGHIEGEVSITLSKDKNKLVSLGTDDLILLWNTNDMTSRRQVQLSNPNDQRFCSVQYSQKNGCFYVGSKAGLVYSMPQFDTGKRDIIYRTPHGQQIFALKLTQCSTYLTIAGENTPVLYSTTFRKFWRAEEGHDGTTYYVNMVRNLKILTSIGNDGYINIYNLNSQSLNETKRSHRFRICHTPSTYPHLVPSEHPSKPLLLLPGAYNLQQLHLTWDPSDMGNENRVQKYECNYKINAEIRSQQQIHKICCLTEDIVVLCSRGKINFYNYFTKSSLHVINYVDLVAVVTDACGRLWGVIDNGTIYAYDGVCMAEREAICTQKYFEQIQKAKEAENQFYQPTLQIQTPEQVQPKAKIKPKSQISISSMLMSLYPQTAIESYYPTHMQFRYLFYNEHGCIIKRTDGDQELTQLEYHDKFKIRKIKFETNQLYTYFALTDRCFLYSNLHQFFFQMQVKTYSCKDDGKIAKTNGLVQWSYNVGVIEGLAIGNQWIAVASKELVYVFDFYGNLLHSICFTRQYLAMCAYQDILVLAYSSSIPYNECYLFEAKVYQITTNKFKLERKIKIPVKVEEQLKWFGFSQEGCLFNQDTSQTIRMYCWENNQWVNVYEEENKVYKVFIQHIENYQIYGFRIQEKDGEPCGPTVLPKSLPRKIMFMMPDRNLSFLTQEQNKRLQKIIVKKISLQHERFRTLRWSKYKYSRKQDPSAIKMSQKIGTEQQIRQSYAQLDMQIVQQVSKILPSIESRMQDQQKKQQAKTQLLCLCKSLLFFTESIQKVTQLIGADHYLQFWDRDSEIHSKQIIRNRVVRRLDQMSRLERMVDMGWISSFVHER